MGMFFSKSYEDDEISKPQENIVYKCLKKARFNNIELCEGDLITNDYKNGAMYIIKDFCEDATPIVQKVSSRIDDFQENRWKFGKNIYLIKNYI